MTENHVRPDTSRRDRIGFDEAILCAGKTPDQLAVILDQARQRSAPLLLTRLSPGQLEELPPVHRSALDYEALSRTAYFGEVAAPVGDSRIAVITAGTSDTPVAREVVRTLAYYGQPCLEVYDVGVAGLWRLLERIEELRDKSVVITVAGMDASLPSVIGGQVPGAVIAVPTSTGYGVAGRGETALRAALVSCAPGVAVVNIDNGFGAACATLRILGTKT
ncbi:MAG: nickel pincer cofactor biosynthesis protein LarB [bacterium]|nr:nickel pincer cofactor biosynthesis protein LarB [bacterium]